MFTDRSSVLGKYQLIAEIAHGGMGIVYLAIVQGPGGFHKLSVVKELKPELVEEPTFLTMFLDEARLAARLSHPNIVQTNEVGNDGDRYFIAMEYLEGRCLDHVRRRSKSAGYGLTPGMQLRVIADTLAGLEYAHKLTDFDGSPLHIVHRDVSPQNVFVTFSGHVKLLDFGIAKAADSSHETRAGVLKGKIAYMSPEQARGQKVDARADVFSAGVMLWEALTGRRLRGHQTDQEKLRALVTGDLPRASTINRSLPPELDEMCARAMAWDPDGRYQSAGEFHAELERFIAASGAKASPAHLADCTSRMFREDRAKVNALIESYIGRARGVVPSSELPVIDISPRASSLATPSDRPQTSAQFNAPELADPPSAPSGNVSVAAPSGPRRIRGLRSKKPLLVTAVSAAATVAIAAVIGLRSGDELPAPTSRSANAPTPTEAPPPAPPPAPSPAPSPAAALPPPVPMPARSVINVEIRASPPTAKLWVDGSELPGNPFAGGYHRDEAIHHVRATAPGYVTKIVSITFDANVKLDLSLERIAQAAPAARPAPRPAPPARIAAPAPVEAPRPVETPPAPPPTPPPAPPSAKSPAEVDPAGGTKPLRKIELNNPYGASGSGRPIESSNPYSGSR